MRAQPLTLAATLSLTLQGESGSVKAKLSAKDRAFKQQLRQASDEMDELLYLPYISPHLAYISPISPQASDEMDELRAELASANAQVASLG